MLENHSIAERSRASREPGKRDDLTTNACEHEIDFNCTLDCEHLLVVEKINFYIYERLEGGVAKGEVFVFHYRRSEGGIQLRIRRRSVVNVRVRFHSADILR